jgi:hypothetical protein
LTLAGRLTRRTFVAQVRQEVYLLSVDEVMKAILYQLVAGGYRIVAALDKEVVLEISADRQTDEEQERVRALIHVAQAPFLGDLAAPCHCGWRSHW